MQALLLSKPETKHRVGATLGRRFEPCTVGRELMNARGTNRGRIVRFEDRGGPPDVEGGENTREGTFLQRDAAHKYDDAIFKLQSARASIRDRNLLDHSDQMTSSA